MEKIENVCEADDASRVSRSLAMSSDTAFACFRCCPVLRYLKPLGLKGRYSQVAIKPLTTPSSFITMMETSPIDQNTAGNSIISPLHGKHNGITSPPQQRGFCSRRCPATCPGAYAWGLGGLSFVNHHMTRVVVHAVLQPQVQRQADLSGDNLRCRCRARKRWVQRIARWPPCMWSDEYLICDQRALRSTEASS